MMLLLLALNAYAADWEALHASEGWSALAHPTTAATGKIALDIKEIDGVPCLRGEATVEPSPDTLLLTATDIDASPRFSREDLTLSKVLERDGDRMDYVQILDVPDWTMASDRFWVLRGEVVREGEARAFRWDRFDWRPAHPELAARIDREHDGAVEPETNWGAWEFEPVEGGTRVRYHLCSTTGGSLPAWVQKAAATKTLPNTMADIVAEAQRREAAD